LQDGVAFGGSFVDPDFFPFTDFLPDEIQAIRCSAPGGAETRAPFSLEKRR
jgi:hypothetical protein